MGQFGLLLHMICVVLDYMIQLFTELEELKMEGGIMEWKEKARWVKYEEDVEWGGEKWSKPHVAALSLHSLFELRSCIMEGTVLLNMEADNLTTIAGRGFERVGMHHSVSCFQALFTG